jgi:eukaryotic-like serine/threonine-protein kinase
VNERFVRCEQCGFPHLATARTCPVTRQPMQSAPLQAPAPKAPAPKAPAPEPPRPKPNAWAEPTRRKPLRPAEGDTQVHGTSVDDAFIGQVISGKYKVRGILGRGGMGTVFEAVHIGIGRQSAIKVLHTSQLRKKDAVRRFHQEAKAAARIGHPNICEVYDLGTLEDGRPYLVMEKLVGETLADAIGREGGLPFYDVIDVLKQVLSGLYAAHENGILHRDIKPENVFLSKRVGCPPVAKLLDFGVSKMMNQHPQSKDDGDMEMTRTGIVLGTPYYLAPEQARGDRNLDARVDLYACGILLYEAVTGKRPFVAANYNALLIQILTGAPRPIRELRKDIPEDLVLIIEKAMARERHQRYHSAVDFQSDLAQIEVPAPPSRAPPPPPRVPSHPPPPNAAPVSRRGQPVEAPFPLRVTRAGLPPSPSLSGNDRGAPVQGREPDGREALRNALPIAQPFLPPPAGEEPPRVRAAMAPPLSSSEEIDALISMETPSAVPRAKSRPLRVKVAHGFEDQPTDVQLPPAFLDDESTQTPKEEAARIAAMVSRAHHPPAPSASGGARRQTLVARRGVEFNDDSKTDVMSPDLRSRMRDVQRASPPAGPTPGTPPSPARSRKR